MARFLSDEWLAQLDEAAAAAAVDPSGSGPGDGAMPVVIEQVVEGGPAGDVTYQLRVVDGRLRFLPGAAERPTVRLRQDHPTAVAVARGELSAQAAFMEGRIRVGGDLRALVDLQGTLTAYDRALAPVRAATTY